MKNDEAILTLTITVHYELGCTDIKELKRVLVAAADHLNDEGLLSGDTEAEVQNWKAEVSSPDDSVRGFDRLVVEGGG